MTYLIEMAAAEWEDINKISVSKMRMILYKAQPAGLIGLGVADGETYIVLHERPKRKESIVLFEPLKEGAPTK